MMDAGGERDRDEKKRELAHVIAVKTRTTDAKPKVEPDTKGAAEELFKGGSVKVNRSDIKGAFAKKYNITLKDQSGIQAALDLLREGRKQESKLAAARAKRDQARKDSSGVSITAPGIEVHLDCDQLKHQPQSQPIGTRPASGGQKFNGGASPEWHEENTLVHMRDWAGDLQMAEGDVQEHGQGAPVANIHYEGFCVYLDGLKYVSFHCYPQRGHNLP